MGSSFEGERAAKWFSWKPAAGLTLHKYLKHGFFEPSFCYQTLSNLPLKTGRYNSVDF